VNRLYGQFDLIFADPPYELNEFEELFTRLSNSHLISVDAIVFVEHSKMTELPNLLPGIYRSTYRIYGDTALSVYRSNSPRVAGEDE
jgi:16S rRNA G966 N2-methylase RsmD